MSTGFFFTGFESGTPVHVSVKTVVQRNQFKLNEFRHETSLFKVETLEARHVGLVLWERDLPDIHQASLTVVVKHLQQNDKTDLPNLK